MNTTNTLNESFQRSQWEDYALCYDGLLHIKPYQEMLSRVACAVAKEPFEAILDASCGTGNFETALYETQYGNTGAVVGIDSSSEMLARAKQKCGNLSMFSFYEADLNKTLGFENETFSAVVSINTLYAVEDPSYTLEEFYRVLKPGGKLFLVTPKHGYENGLILKDHCGSSLPDDFWKDAHKSPEREECLIRKAVNDKDVIQSMLSVARHNRNIIFNTPFHFFCDEELGVLLSKVSFAVRNASPTYANQSVFIIAQKE